MLQYFQQESSDSDSSDDHGSSHCDLSILIFPAIISLTMITSKNDSSDDHGSSHCDLSIMICPVVIYEYHDSSN